MPKNHHILQLIIKQCHLITLHGGPQLTVNQIRQNYWIQDVRNLARHFIFKCKIRYKHQPKFEHQQMGALPIPRVSENVRAFASMLVLT